jgi:FtsZ-binding cell division protein ZapB
MENNKENINVDNIQDFDSTETKKPGTTYTIVVILLIAFLLVVGYMYVDQRQKTKKVVAELNSVSSEKTKVRNELNELLIEYDDLQTDNDSLNTQLKEEQEKIKVMLKDLKTVKANNHAQITKYKNELSTLRKVMKGFIHTIDSLNTLNIELTEENIKVKQEFNQVFRRKSELEEQNKDLSSQVEKASVIKTMSFSAQGMNLKGKEQKKAKKVERFEVCFTLGENIIVESGLRDVYIRIARPDELVLIESEENLFDFEGQEIVYSAKRQVDYQNEEIEMCVYFDNNPLDELIPGDYFIDIFVDGNQIGTSILELK